MLFLKYTLHFNLSQKNEILTLKLVMILKKHITPTIFYVENWRMH